MIILIENREKKHKLLAIRLLICTAVRQSIAVFLFLKKYSICLNISALLKYKSKYVGFHRNARGYIHARFNFAYNCEICFIRGPPVLFEQKIKQNGGNMIETIVDRRYLH